MVKKGGPAGFVDAAAEKGVRKALRVGGRDRAAIIIVRRLGSLRNADRIQVL